MLTQKQIFIMVGGLIIFFGTASVVWYFVFRTNTPAQKQAAQEASQQAQTSSNSNQDTSSGEQANDEESMPQPDTDTEPTYSLDKTDSLWLVVNKTRPIPITYVPSDLVVVKVEKRTDKSDEELMLRKEAGKQMEALFAAAQADGVDLLMGSAYRSANLQATYYNNYVATYGQEEADTFSAKPGTSEHQTGLAADLSTPDRVCYLEICFADTPAGKWLAAHAHEFGFTIRYQKGKETITGYQYEPWHVRYVGTSLAQELFDAKQTMEDYFDL